MDLNSKSIGLVLSGGSKGIAHAGAIKFLEEQNIRPTRLWNKRRRNRVQYPGERVLMRF
jgi:hypothetical protein